MNSPIIHAERLSRTYRIPRKRPGLGGAFKDLLSPEYRTVDAVKNVTFDIQPGESVAYLGPNGAGKSTTVKMLAGILKPSSGELNVLGYHPHRDRQAYVKNIGVVFGQNGRRYGPTSPSSSPCGYCNACTPFRRTSSSSASRCSTRCSTWASCSPPPPASSHWASASAPTSPRRCCTTRVQLVVHLKSGERTVTQLTEALNQPQSTISRHLALLRAANLVKTRREHTSIHYRLADAHISQLVTEVFSHAQHERLGLPDHPAADELNGGVH